MGQNAPSFRLNFGGGLEHSIGILIASYLLEREGFKFENPEWLAKKAIHPGVPDVYVSKTEKGIKRFWIIEIESHETKLAKAKKLEQFRNNILNHELIIIDLTGLKNHDSIKELEELIKSRLP